MSDTKHWTHNLSEEQLAEIERARAYAAEYAKGGHVNHLQLVLINDLANKLDTYQSLIETQTQTLDLVASQLTQAQGDQPQSFGLEALTQNPQALRQLFFAVLAAAPALATFSKEATALLSELSEGELTTEEAMSRLKGLVALLAPVVALVPMAK